MLVRCSDTSTSFRVPWKKTTACCWWWERRRAARRWPATVPARVARACWVPGRRGEGARAAAPIAPTVLRTRRCGRPVPSTWPPEWPIRRRAPRRATGRCPAWPHTPSRSRSVGNRSSRQTARRPCVPGNRPSTPPASPSTWTPSRPATEMPCPTRNPATTQWRHPLYRHTHAHLYR